MANFQVTIYFNNEGDLTQSLVLDVIADADDEDVIACIVEYTKPFYELKHEYENKSKQDQHHSKIMMLAKIGAMGITNFDFDGALNELAYLYSQYKDVV